MLHLCTALLNLNAPLHCWGHAKKKVYEPSYISMRSSEKARKCSMKMTLVKITVHAEKKINKFMTHLICVQDLNSFSAVILSSAESGTRQVLYYLMNKKFLYSRVMLFSSCRSWVETVLHGVVQPAETAASRAIKEPVSQSKKWWISALCRGQISSRKWGERLRQ